MNLGSALAAAAAALVFAAPTAALDSSAIDFAFIRPGFVTWHVDRRDVAGECGVLGYLAPPSQWGLPEDLYFLAGEPLASAADGRDEQIIIRQSWVDPGQLRWWVKINNQAQGGFSGFWEEGDFGLVGDVPFIWRRFGSADRAAVKQGGLLIADTNRNLAYDDGIDLVMSWNVEIAPGDRIFGVPISGGASSIVVWRAATSMWQFYFDVGIAISPTPYASFVWGAPGMIPAVADANGDSFPDLMLFEPSTKQLIINHFEAGAGAGGFAGGTDCAANYATQLDPIDSGEWLQFVAMNLGGFDDWDGDGVLNDLDGCPWDANKVTPGACGCGVPETDSDGDLFPDCIDLCPLDPFKTAPGICGCGVSDLDSDLDGVPDCNDGCPYDPNKTSPGACGCGVVDQFGDVNCDGVVGPADLGLLLNAWGPCGPNCIADFNGDGVVNAADLGILLGFWTQ